MRGTASNVVFCVRSSGFVARAVWGVLLSCTLLPSLAQADSPVYLTPGFAGGSLNLQINRNGDVLVAYGDDWNHSNKWAVYHGGIVSYSTQPRDTYYPYLTNYGVVASAARQGYRQALGQPLEIIYDTTSDLNAVASALAANDQGVCVWRYAPDNHNTTVPSLYYLRLGETTPTNLLPGPYDNANILVDPQGRVITSYYGGRYFGGLWRYTPGAGWAQLATAGAIRSAGAGPMVNSAGHFVYEIFNYPTSTLCLYNDQGSQQIIQTNASPASVEINDRDDVLDLIHNDYGPGTAYMKSLGGGLIDVATLLPAGWALGSTPQVHLNNNGWLGIAATDASRSLGFFIYDGVTTRQVLGGDDATNVAVAYNPFVLDDSGRIYFTKRQDNGLYALAYVPEPATLSLLALGGLAMLRRRKMAVAALAMFVLPGLSAWGQTPSIQLLGKPANLSASLPIAISDDGSVVAVNSYYDPPYHGAVWTASAGWSAPTGDQPWEVQVTGLSGDGSTVIGWNSQGGLRWKRGQAPEYLPNPSQNMVFPRGVSADGSVIVGDTRGGNVSQQAYRWSASEGATSLTWPGQTQSGATLVTADGKTVFGGYQLNGFSESCLWSEADGAQHLPILGIAGINSTGTVVAGYDDIGQVNTHPYIWSEAAGKTYLPLLSHFQSFTPYAISDTGLVVGGCSDPSVSLGLASKAWIWSSATGTMLLKDYLQNVVGLDTTGIQLGWARDITPDGQHILCGVQTGTGAYLQAAIITIPEPATLSLLALAGLLVAGRRRHHRHLRQ